MPEIAESMASKEDEEDYDDEGGNDDFNLDMQYVPGKVSQSQKVEQITKNQSTPSPEKTLNVGPRPDKVDEHPQKQPLTMTVETEQHLYNSCSN